MKPLALALALALLLPLTARAADPTLADLVGNRAPAQAQRTMLSPTPANQRIPDIAYTGGYELIGRPAELSEAQAASLAALVKDPAAFSDSETKRCGFRPGVAFRFGAGTSAVDLLVCFSCDEAAVTPVGGEVVKTTGFAQPTREILLQFTKELFPDDEAIRGLPAIRSEGTAPPPPAPVPEDAPRQGSAPPTGGDE